MSSAPKTTRSFGRLSDGTPRFTLSELGTALVALLTVAYPGVQGWLSARDFRATAAVQIARCREEQQKVCAEVEGLRKTLDAHRSREGHPQIVARLGALDRRIERGEGEDKEFRAEVRRSLSEILRELRGLSTKVAALEAQKK